MEEILLSIRRIIADDQALFANGVAASDEVRQAARPGPADPAQKEVPPNAATLGPKRASIHAPEDSARAGVDADPEPSILSAAASASVASAFDALVATRFLRNSDTVAALTQNLLRPMLKAWLDDNLPALVERLVRAEIERIARDE
jgi:hypothetical protein